MNDHVPAQPPASGDAPLPNVDQRLVAVRALYGLLTEDTREARNLAAAHLLDVLGEVYDADENGFFGTLAAEFQVPLVPETLAVPQVPEPLLARAEEVTSCGRLAKHSPHGDCDGLLRRRKPRST